MSKKDPYSALIERVSDTARGEMEQWVEDADLYCESPIEKLFYVALNMVCTFGLVEFNHCINVEDEQTVEHLQNGDAHKLWLLIHPQPQLDGWRPDFMIHYYDFGYPNREAKWSRLIVECDGHDFHERSKAQAALDRKRDRLSQHQGLPVLRFTGSELWRDPWGCANEVIGWAQKGL